MRIMLTAFATLFAAACGTMTSESKAPDVAGYKQLTADVTAAVENHKTISASATAESCPAEASRYNTEVRPMLERMSAMSMEMDSSMQNMSCCSGTGSSGADMHSTCQSMMTELDTHMGAACSTGDISGEAERHAGAMNTMLQHEMQAADKMQQMMNGSMMSQGGCGH